MGTVSNHTRLLFGRKGAKFLGYTGRKAEADTVWAAQVWTFGRPCTGPRGSRIAPAIVWWSLACSRGWLEGSRAGAHHPQAVEVVQPAADERACVRQQHLHAQVAAQAVEAVEEPGRRRPAAAAGGGGEAPARPGPPRRSVREADRQQQRGCSTMGVCARGAGAAA